MEVIIYQEGPFPGLKWCIESVRVHSPSSKITVIGEDIIEGVPFVKASGWLDAFNAVAPYYVHESPNPVEFELRCLKRWFVILEYSRSIEMDRFVTLDSDMLCFCDFKQLESSLSKTDMWSGHASFAGIFNRHGLRMFCKAIDWAYKHNDSRIRKRMRQLWESRESCTGISDMNLMAWFMSTRKDLGLCDPTRRADVIDTNICHTNGFLADGNRKRLFWLDGYPYAVADDRRIVRMNTLHCWFHYHSQMEEIWRRSRESVGNPNPMPFL